MEEIKYYESKYGQVFFSLDDVQKVTKIPYKNYSIIYKNPNTYYNFNECIFIEAIMFSVILAKLPKSLKNKNTSDLYVDFDNIHHLEDETFTKCFDYKEIELKIELKNG